MSGVIMNAGIFRPRRIRRSRAAGSRLPAGAVVVTRPTAYGNPWIVGETICVPVDGGSAWLSVEVTPALAVALFAAWVTEPAQEALVTQISDLRGKDLACWCPLDEPCHADVILAIANGWDR